MMLLAAAFTAGVSTHTLDPQDYKSLGADLVRIDMPWSSVNHHDGEHWDSFDRWTDNMLLQGVQPMYIMQWDKDGKDSNLKTDHDRQEFAWFVHKAIHRYPHGIFEILNEPNLDEYMWVSPDDYVRTVDLIRTQSPTAKIVGPALGGPYFDGEWLDGAFRAGLLDLVDAVSVHPYAAGSPAGAPAYFRTIRNMMKGMVYRGPYGERPIIVSEWGFLTPYPLDQAQMVYDALEVCRDEEIGICVIYCWKDTYTELYGLHDVHGNMKPSGVAFKTFSRFGR